MPLVQSAFTFPILLWRPANCCGFDFESQESQARTMFLASLKKQTPVSSKYPSRLDQAGSDFTALCGIV